MTLDYPSCIGYQIFDITTISFKIPHEKKKRSNGSDAYCGSELPSTLQQFRRQGRDRQRIEYSLTFYLQEPVSTINFEHRSNVRSQPYSWGVFKHTSRCVELAYSEPLDTNTPRLISSRPADNIINSERRIWRDEHV